MARKYDQELKKDDTYPSFAAQIVRSDGVPIDVQGETVEAWIKKPSAGAFAQGGGTVQILDANGNIAYPWAAADTDESGTLELEFRFTKNSKLGTSPGDRFYLVRIRDH